ncbi:MAG TPA: hypothetical protein DCW29_21225 [Janthinobacterium sp.]|nr:hypothetical protein [Janthinobacterium sp.]
MDERIYSYKAGQPIPTWDLRHRLPIDKPVGPECKDAATIFRINSTFMDVTDQPYMQRQWTAGGVLAACFAVGMLISTAQFILSLHRTEMSAAMIGTWVIIFISIAGFGYFGVKLGRDEFFALTRRPIRFNRKEQKLYTIRRRRFFAKAGEGDVTWEAPWNAQSIFCIHKGEGTTGDPFHIRHYTVDDQGNVVRAFSIGREWQGKGNLQGLLSQWNFWCEYMNKGPADLPKPPLFFSERENIRETFLFCLYDFGLTVSSGFRIAVMPFILLWTSFRLIAQWTCRAPVWPATVEAVSAIAPDDAFSQPRGDTPVGWAETALASERHDWPFDPKKDVANWHGEKDRERNGSLWAADIPPKLP